MSDGLKSRVLRLLRVPAEPQPPFGEEGSVRIFRASNHFYHLNLLRWGLRQVAVVAGILFALMALNGTGDSRKPLQQLADVPQAHNETAGTERPDFVEDLANGTFFLSPDRLFALFHLVESLGLLLFVLQLPVTLMLVRLDYELRWYIVTDRSLRIREGIVRINELTLAFANVQDVSIQQNPIQRLLGRIRKIRLVLARADAR